MGDPFQQRIEAAKEEVGIDSRAEAWYRIRSAGLDVGFGTYQRWEQKGGSPRNYSEDEIIDALKTRPQEKLEMYSVPEVEMGAGDDVATEVKNGHLVLPRSYIRSEYGIRPERLVIVRVRGRSMLDTLEPGQKVLAARHEGDELEDDVIYGLRGPLGFTVKRLKFDRQNGQPVIWVWSDNDEESDRRHYLPPEEFQDEYNVVAKALEVGQKL